MRAKAEAPKDHGELCLDVGAIRACWGGACGNAGCVVPRPLPTAIAPTSGFRCAGQGGARSCVARAQHAGPFRCDAKRCAQRRPRMPDNGEWECVDIAGAVYCRHVVSAAGIMAGPVEAGFLCGQRQGGKGRERICVDLAPDLPALATTYSCSFSYPAGVAERVCQPSQRPVLGSACAAHSACPEGASCVSGFCLPARPRPMCWLDSDCAEGARCRFGSCLGTP